MTEFTPLSAALGGGLIGLAAVLLMATTGRIAGISGFVSRLLPPYADKGFVSRAAFVAGIVIAPALSMVLTGEMPEVSISGQPLLLVVAGLLVGFGAVYGNGCTSGHGVCGTARLSKRSLTATAVFMAVAIAVVFLVRHGLGG